MMIKGFCSCSRKLVYGKCKITNMKQTIELKQWPSDLVTEIIQRKTIINMSMHK